MSVPHLYADGVVIPKKALETDAYIDVPVLMLTGTTEFSMFAYGDEVIIPEAAWKVFQRRSSLPQKFCHKIWKQNVWIF